MAILTETQIEVAAKKYCELAGLDPEKWVQVPSPTDDRGFTYDVYIQHKQWRLVASRVREQNIMDEAIQHASSM
jgi:hypothetical protein